MTVGTGRPGATFEDAHAPQRHGWFLRTVFTLAAQDHRVSPRSALPVAVLMIVALLISGLWQVVAVYVAARYELGLDTLIPVLAAGAVVALLVMAFDWDVLYHRIRGESRISVLVIRLLFVAVMALLVSEAVAGWVFDKDITQQIQRENDEQRALVGERVDQDKPALAALASRCSRSTRRSATRRPR